MAAEEIRLDALPDGLIGGTVAIGNFDGVHRGHQSVLAAALEGPRPVLALTFEPHPRAFFARAPIFRLTPADEKARLVEALGLDALVVADFDAALAGLHADHFVETVLVERLRAQHVVVGHDFKYGARRLGNAAHLAGMGARHGFGVRIVPAFSEGSEPVSSSRVRALLAEGDVVTAARLLGYRYRIAAPVIHGQKLGRTMGYPTANMALEPANGLRHGIYAVRALVGGVWHDGVASFGRRPTFDNGAPLLETFVFDFSGDLYGKPVRIAFERFLRPELKFEGMDALMAQMDADSADARAALAGIAPLSRPMRG